MKPRETSAEALRWWRYAVEDLETSASIAAGEMGTARHACWMAQQAAEKALKAVLVAHAIDFPRSHDLHLLRSLLPENLPVHDALNDLGELTVWAVESRYPGDWPEATATDADRAVRIAQRVLDLLGAELQPRRPRKGQADA